MDFLTENTRCYIHSDYGIFILYTVKKLLKFPEQFSTFEREFSNRKFLRTSRKRC